MRMILRFAAMCLTVFAAAIQVNSQTSTISRAEFQRLLNGALDASDKFTRRVTVLEETKLGNKLIGSTRAVEEFLPPGRVKYVDVISSAGKSVKREIIRTGNAGYSMDDNGPWIEWHAGPWRPLLKYLPPENELDEERTYVASDEILNGQAMKTIIREENQNSNGILSSERFTIWIAQDGLIYKSEFLRREEKGEGMADIRLQSAVAFWDYDPKGMEIKAPIR